MIPVMAAAAKTTWASPDLVAKAATTPAKYTKPTTRTLFHAEHCGSFAISPTDHVVMPMRSLDTPSYLFDRQYKW
jgi:hypothetical protein